MDRTEIVQYIAETYRICPDYPWAKYPEYMVFRHSDNQKWFALVMRIPKEKLGMQEKTLIDVINVKCDPFIIGSLRQEAGIYPAYHMSKTNWITIALDGSVKNEKIEWLLEMSYELTAKEGKHDL